MMVQLRLIILLYLINYYLFTKSTSLLISEKILNITEGIYLIKNNNMYLNFNDNSLEIFFSKNPNSERYSSFSIYREQDNKLKDYFYIRDKYSLYYLVSSDNYPEIIFSLKLNNTEKALWKIYPKIKDNNELIYYIKNKFYDEYIQIENNIKNYDYNGKCYLTTEISTKNELKLIKLYTEKRNDMYSNKLLENEPIDVLIKYIDLYDPNLKRKNIKEIEKDEDNNELKYSLRSIIQNIPWIRKIYILMPNEKVSFLKPKDEIKNKIIYIKDHELIGFNSSSNSVFLFNLFKMKKFGLSENFIYMDDDYFIGKPLNKSNFFYEENNKVYPLLISDSFKEMNRTKLLIQQKKLYKKVGKYSQTPIDFHFRKVSTLLFLYEIFGEDKQRRDIPLIEAEFNHNTIPLKLSDIEEVNEYIKKKYKYYKETLESSYRHIRSLQPQILFMCYARNKYDRWAQKIVNRFFTLDNVGELSINFIPKLFVINTSDKKYNYFKYKLEILKLITFFPNKTEYELSDENEELIIKYINEGKYNKTFLLEHIKIKKRKYQNPDYNFLWIILLFIIIFIIFYMYIKKKYRNKSYSIFNDISNHK